MIIKKKIVLLAGGLVAMATPIASVVSCNPATKYDLFIFTGKNENLQNLKDSAVKFSQLYNAATGKSIKIRVNGAGNGQDANSIIKSLMQNKTSAPDIITSFGVGSVKQYVEGGLIEEIKKNDLNLSWAFNDSNSVASSKITNLLKEGLTLKNKNGVSQQWGLPLAYESVGVVVNLKTLGKFIKANSEIIISGVKSNTFINASESDFEIGKSVLEKIYQNGWSKKEMNELIKKFNQVTNGGGAFAMNGKSTESWIGGFHMVPNWLSTRNGSKDLHSNTAPWIGYTNTFETLYPMADPTNSNSQKEDVFAQNASKNPIEYIATKMSTEKTTVKSVINDYYKTMLGKDMWSAQTAKTVSPTDAFLPFGDGRSLFTHASSGMSSWIIKTIGANKISLNDIAPIPMPLNTNGGDDKYKDIPVDVGMLWHIVKKEEKRSKLSKQFLQWLSTGATKVIKGGEEVEINDKSGVKLFYASTNSHLVNPYNISQVSGQDSTSLIVSKEISGQDYGDSSTSKTDNVTLWTNGGLAGFGGSNHFGELIYDKVGQDDYTGDVSQKEWDYFKERANINVV